MILEVQLGYVFSICLLLSERGHGTHPLPLSPDSGERVQNTVQTCPPYSSKSLSLNVY